MKVKDFVNKALDIANNYKTLYVMGCFGAPLNAKNKKRYTTNHSYNKKSSRTKMINNASSDTFGFDCVCLIKAILWGWSGDKSKSYGGAKYCSNGVPDVGADAMISKHCNDVSTNFKNIEYGEVVWLKGHIGIYIGNGEVVESSPAFKNKVQITKLSQRNWTKHGKLKYIDYSKPVENKPAAKPSTSKPASKPKLESAKKHNVLYALGKTYKTKEDLNLRYGAGKDKAKIGTMAKDTKVKWYGYYTDNWYLVKVTSGALKGKTGYCSKNYLK